MSKGSVLTAKQRQRALAKLPDWKPLQKGRLIKARFPQASYIDGLVFIARIAVHAEITNHHPTITYEYNCVTVTLTTHEAKGLTKKDFALATKISNLYPTTV